jgi:hypothetical protein
MSNSNANAFVQSSTAPAFVPSAVEEKNDASTTPVLEPKCIDKFVAACKEYLVSTGMSCTLPDLEKLVYVLCDNEPLLKKIITSTKTTLSLDDAINGLDSHIEFEKIKIQQKLTEEKEEKESQSRCAHHEAMWEAWRKEL